MGIQRHSNHLVSDSHFAMGLALADDDDDDFQSPVPTQALLLKHHQSSAKSDKIPHNRSRKQAAKANAKISRSSQEIAENVKSSSSSPRRTKKPRTVHSKDLAAVVPPFAEITNTSHQPATTITKEEQGPAASTAVMECSFRTWKGMSLESRLLGRGKDNEPKPAVHVCDAPHSKTSVEICAGPNSKSSVEIRDGRPSKSSAEICDGLQGSDAANSKVDCTLENGTQTQSTCFTMGTQMNALLNLCCSGDGPQEAEQDCSDAEENENGQNRCGQCCSEGEDEDISSLLTQVDVAKEMPILLPTVNQKDLPEHFSGDAEDNGLAVSPISLDELVRQECASRSRSSGVVEERAEKPTSEYSLDRNGAAPDAGCSRESMEEVSGKACLGMEEMWVFCPVCEANITDLSDLEREIHTNECLDKEEVQTVIKNNDCPKENCNKNIADTTVVKWLDTLGLSRYADVFVKEEIDWDTLRWLTEDDLSSLGITALGPRRKIAQALHQLRNECNQSTDNPPDINGQKLVFKQGDCLQSKENKIKLITEYFPASSGTLQRPDVQRTENFQRGVGCTASIGQKRGRTRNKPNNDRMTGIPQWLSIPGTPFRVDAFRYLRGDCSHWFLTHFHSDHYQGLTKGFRYGKVYCSLVTAKLVHLRIGVPWERLHVFPLNEKINIEGVNVTFMDANHCPGSVIILFEPPNEKPVLHTGDFRFCQDMINNPILDTCTIHTLILDTTYCSPQYDFPKQEAVIDFVLEAIQAEAFNPRTLFLIGTYTIGKERIFLEVARVLRKKVYVGAAKLRILGCMGLPEEDMHWLTANEHESHIHVVPLWSIANFRRMNFISKRYHGQYNSIVAFSPTGWAFGKGKKKTPGKRWQQGTLIRYEVPYSEHCSFTELKEFVKFIAPDIIIPSVNNRSVEASNNMVDLLLRDKS